MNKLKLILVFCILLILSSASTALAKNGYKIKVQFTDVKEDTKLYLCYYFGVGHTAQRMDSVLLKNGSGVFSSKKEILGGIYLLLFKDKSASLEFILLNGDNLSLIAKKKSIVETLEIKGKSENSLFIAYHRFLGEYGKENKELLNILAQAKNKKDSTAIKKQLRDKAAEIKTYREGVIRKHPKTFIAKVFSALSEPEVPSDWPALDDGVKDSTFPSRYYQKHYWDGFDFKEDRLAYTPIYGPKLKNYMSNWVIPDVDTVKAVCDWLLKETEESENLFHYSLWYLTRWTETSKIMGMDEAFVYLVEEYYMQGKTPWLKEEQLKKYIKRAKAIAPNMIGQAAKEVKARDSNNVFTPLLSVKAPYTLVVFYAADCGHCKHELPLIDSLYKAELHKYGVKIFAMETKNIVKKWKKLIRDQDLGAGWIHVYDPEVITNYKSSYDAYTNPTIYLLDDKKKIVAKRINHSNILDVIQREEKLKNKKGLD